MSSNGIEDKFARYCDVRAALENLKQEKDQLKKEIVEYLSSHNLKTAKGDNTITAVLTAPTVEAWYDKDEETVREIHEWVNLIGEGHRIKTDIHYQSFGAMCGKLMKKASRFTPRSTQKSPLACASALTDTNQKPSASR